MKRGDGVPANDPIIGPLRTRSSRSRPLMNTAFEAVTMSVDEIEVVVIEFVCPTFLSASLNCFQLLSMRFIRLRIANDDEVLRYSGGTMAGFGTPALRIVCLMAKL